MNPPLDDKDKPVVDKSAARASKLIQRKVDLQAILKRLDADVTRIAEKRARISAELASLV